LQHDFERSALELDVRPASWKMPNALGFVEMQRVVLRIRALQYVPAAAGLLDDWYAVMRLAYARWLADPRTQLTARDVLDLLEGDPQRTRFVSLLLLRESWALGSGQGGPNDDWSREINSDVRLARSASSAAELLEARGAIEFPLTPVPIPPPGAVDRARLRRAWDLASNNQLVSAVLAAAIIAAGGTVIHVATRSHHTAPQQQPPTTTGPGSRPPVGPSRGEQAGTGGARSFANPQALSGEGPPVRPGKRLRVSCKVYAPAPRSVVPDGYWYRLASVPWSGRYYAPANSFWNGDRPGHKPYTHNTDFGVPTC
jgi:hypothetical protein